VLDELVSRHVKPVELMDKELGPSNAKHRKSTRLLERLINARVMEEDSDADGFYYYNLCMFITIIYLIHLF
jgi:dolichol kinase